MTTPPAPRIVVTSGPSHGRAPGGSSASRRRRPPVLWLVALLLPFAEVAVLIAAGRTIGVWWTLALLVLMAGLGGWLVRREGRAGWSTLRRTVRAGRVPTREVSDAALVLLAGVLLVLPGLLSDVAAVFLLVPTTRGWVRRSVERSVERRVARSAGVVRSVVVGRGNDAAQDPIVLPHMDLRPRD